MKCFWLECPSLFIEVDHFALQERRLSDLHGEPRRRVSLYRIAHVDRLYLSGNRLSVRLLHLHYMRPPWPSAVATKLPASFSMGTRVKSEVTGTIRICSIGSPGRKMCVRPSAGDLKTTNAIIGHHSVPSSAGTATGTVSVVSV